VPPSLAEVLLDWVECLFTPEEEIAEVAGWDVAEVTRHLAQARPAATEPHAGD
jgi:hypothetical protein